MDKHAHSVVQTHKLTCLSTVLTIGGLGLMAGSVVGGWLVDDAAGARLGVLFGLALLAVAVGLTTIGRAGSSRSARRDRPDVFLY